MVWQMQRESKKSPTMRNSFPVYSRGTSSKGNNILGPGNSERWRFIRCRRKLSSFATFSKYFSAFIYKIAMTLARQSIPIHEPSYWLGALKRLFNPTTPWLNQETTWNLLPTQTPTIMRSFGLLALLPAMVSSAALQCESSPTLKSFVASDWSFDSAPVFQWSCSRHH